VSAARSKFEEIGRILREHQRFAVMSHVRPDGDALGSQLALALSLQQLGKEVRVWNEEGMLEKYSFLPRAELVTNPGRFRLRHCARHRNSKSARNGAGCRSVGEDLD